MTASGGYHQTAGVTRLFDATLQSFGADPFQFDGGTLEGSGNVFGSLVNGGRVSPGLSAGRLFIQGDYTQEAGGCLRVEIGGRTAQTQYDVLGASGQAMLAGALDVSLIDGFVPDPGDEFTILTAASRSGSFDSTSGLVIGGGLGFEVHLGAKDVVLQAVFENCANGIDDDGDGHADCADAKCQDAPNCQATPAATVTATVFHRPRRHGHADGLERHADGATAGPPRRERERSPRVRARPPTATRIPSCRR